MILHIKGGIARMVYDERLDLRGLGAIDITRASRVEPDADGRWTADLGIMGGPVLGPFWKRSQALAAEAAWIEERI